jgi:carotenoid cleavage dioxygenase-like enzyme
MDSGATQRHDFGADQYCLEPVFAPAPGTDGDGDQQPGWLLTLVYDARRNASRLSVLDATHVTDGPIAEVHLDHPLPFRFHGTWWPGS